jgi:hypothetical protein
MRPSEHQEQKKDRPLSFRIRGAGRVDDDMGPDAAAVNRIRIKTAYERTASASNSSKISGNGKIPSKILTIP